MEWNHPNPTPFMKEATPVNNSIAYKLTQVPANALRVGIDPHKHDHAAVISDAQTHVLAKFKVKNLRPGFEHLLAHCDQVSRERGGVDYIFAIEAGAHYWRTLAQFLDDKGKPYHLINPFTLKRQRDGNDLMRRKNDYRDAQMAAELLGQGRYTWTTPAQGIYAELREAFHLQQSLVADAARLKQQLISALDCLFPEFQTVFKSVACETALALLNTCPSPVEIASMTVEDLIARLRLMFPGQRLAIKKIRTVHSLAQTTVGLRNGAESLSMTVHSLADRLCYMMTQLQQAEDHVAEILHNCPESSYLLSIIGLGPINSAGLLAHIGDISHFSSVKQLSKLAGIVPTEDNSAGHATGAAHISKKGRPNFRLVLYRSVLGLLRHNPVFKQYVTGLTGRAAQNNPLKKKEAMVAAMNKLLRTVYALLTKRQMFRLTAGQAA
jgi:transposase